MKKRWKESLTRPFSHIKKPLKSKQKKQDDYSKKLFEYDEHKNQTSVTVLNERGSEQVQRTEYEYDADGRISCKRENAGSKNELAYNYTYDEDGNLVKVECSQDELLHTFEYSDYLYFYCP